MRPPSGSAPNRHSNFAIAMLKQTKSIPSLPDLRKMCDECYSGGGPPNPSKGVISGASVTSKNPDRLECMREMAKLALKFYKKKTRMNKNLELVKLCKANHTGGRYRGLTFTAAEDGSDEGLVFRGVLRCGKVLFCEVKDEIKLVPGDEGGSESREDDGGGGEDGRRFTSEQVSRIMANARLPWWKRPTFHPSKK